MTHRAPSDASDSPASAPTLHRLVELPREAAADDGEPDVDPFGAQRMAALVARYHGRGEGLTWMWHRATTGGRVSLLTSDRSVAPASSEFASADGIVEELSAVSSWVFLDCRHDGLLDENGGADHHASRRSRSRSRSGRGNAVPSMEACLLAVWDRPFTLLVSAEPVLLEQIDEELDATVRAMRAAGQRKENTPDRAVEYERLRSWHRELRQGESTGLWRVRVRVGAPNPADARAVAGLAVGSFDTSTVGYSLSPWQGDVATYAGSLAGTDLLAALTRPPSSEVPGIRLAVPSEFDVTVENPNGEIELGRVLDRGGRPAGGFRVGLESLNRHTFVCGATGAGKSQTVRHLLTEATRNGVFWTVVEPAKSEYAAMAARLPEHEVVRIRPGDPSLVACGIDPMRPADGFPLQTHLDLTKALFLAAFEADEPFPQVLAAALTRAYTDQGWDLALSEPLGVHEPRYPTLADVQRCALEVVEEIGYGREVEDNIRGFMRVRLGSLRLGTTGRFLEGGYPLDIGKVLTSNVVLEIEDVADDAEKAFIMGAFLIAITEHCRTAQRRGQQPGGTLRHLTVFEEAHRLLRNTEERERGAASNAVEMFASLLAEVRAYGEGIVVAEQIPSKLIPDVIKNTAVKVVHRLPAKDDRESVGATMNLSDAQSRYLVTVPPGIAGCFADGMDLPILVRMPDGTETETSARAVPVDALGLVGSTFGRCGAAYGMVGLDPPAIAKARRRLEGDALSRWWAELTVLAHLTGYRAPHPTFAVDSEFGLRTVQTVLTLAVDDAVASRSALLVDRMSPPALAAHVAHALFGILDGGTRCGHEHQWAAEPFRWEVVYRQLRDHRAADGDHPCGRRHPASAGWETRYGTTVPGETCVEQFDSILRWRRESITGTIVEDIMFGTEPVSALETSVDSHRQDPGWPGRVRAMTTALKSPWAERLLVNKHLPEIC